MPFGRVCVRVCECVCVIIEGIASLPIQREGGSVKHHIYDSIPRRLTYWINRTSAVGLHTKKQLVCDVITKATLTSGEFFMVTS